MNVIENLEQSIGRKLTATEKCTVNVRYGCDGEVFIIALPGEPLSFVDPSFVDLADT